MNWNDHLRHHNVDFSMNDNHLKHFCLIVRNWKVIWCEFQIAKSISSRIAESSKVTIDSISSSSSISFKVFKFSKPGFSLVRLWTASGPLPVHVRFVLHCCSQISSLFWCWAGSGDIIARTWMTYIFWYEVYLGLTATNPCYFGWYIKGRYTSTNGWTSISFRWMITLGDN